MASRIVITVLAAGALTFAGCATDSVSDKPRADDSPAAAAQQAQRSEKRLLDAREYVDEIAAMVEAQVPSDGLISNSETVESVEVSYVEGSAKRLTFHVAVTAAPSGDLYTATYLADFDRDTGRLRIELDPESVEYAPGDSGELPAEPELPAEGAAPPQTYYYAPPQESGPSAPFVPDTPIPPGGPPDDDGLWEDDSYRYGGNTEPEADPPEEP